MAATRKSVLGNDPFQRGAAPSPPPIQVSKAPRRAKSSRRKAPSDSAPIAAQPAPPRSLEQAVRSAEPSTATRTSAASPASPVGWFFKFLFEQYWRVRVEGSDQVPTGPCLLIANHAGALPLDGAMVAMALQRTRPDLPEPRWLAEEQILSFPILGGTLFELGAVGASFQNGLKLLREGRAVLVFPEGTHGLSKPIFNRYQLKRFGRGGFLRLAFEAQVPVIPVGVVGAEEAMPALGKLPGALGLPYVPITLPPLPTRWTIRFGSPLKLDANAEALDDETLQRQTEIAKDSVQAVVKALLAERHSLFW